MCYNIEFLLIIFSWIPHIFGMWLKLTFILTLGPKTNYSLKGFLKIVHLMYSGFFCLVFWNQSVLLSVVLVVVVVVVGQHDGAAGRVPAPGA